MLLRFILLCFIALTNCEIVSPTNTYNVTLPEPNAPYVAGQMLPISYTLPDNINLPKLLSLSIFFTTQEPTLNFTDTVITSEADISQGYSFKRTHNTYVYYEHQLSYSIPKNTLPVVRPYAAPANTLSANRNKARPSGGGSIFAMHANDGHSMHNSWSVPTLTLSLLLLTVIF